MLVQMNDRAEIDDKANARITTDGYLVAMPRVARTGVQLYRGSEVGMPQMDTVRVYRPETEVFSKDSLASYAFKPITNDHPPKPVTSDNWRDYSVGNASGEIARDGEFIRVPMLVMDRVAIEDVRDGKRELSVGYSTELKWESGTSPKGDAYDAIQTDIRVNHIAIVDAARGGPKLKIGDTTAPDHSKQTPADAAANTEEGPMTDTTKKVTAMVDGIPLEMSDIAASVVTKALADTNEKLKSSTAQVTTLTTQLDAAKKEHDATVAKLTTEHKTATDQKDAEIATLKKQVEDSRLTPEKIEVMVRDRSTMLTKAKAVLGDKLVIDGKSDHDIRKQVVDAQMGDAAKGWDENQIKISFDTLTAGVKITAPAVSDTARAFSTNMPQANDRTALYAKRDADLSQRWRNPGQVKTA